MKLINATVDLENNGRSFQIRIVEEQMVVNTFLKTDCACPGWNLEDSSLNPSIGESKKQQQNRDEDDDVADGLDLVEEVAETEGNTVVNESKEMGAVADNGVNCSGAGNLGTNNAYGSIYWKH